MRLKSNSPENIVGAELTDGADEVVGSLERDGVDVGDVDNVGVADGAFEGESDGTDDGDAVGVFVGAPGTIGTIGDMVGLIVGDFVGDNVEGDPVGDTVGLAVTG